MRETVIDESNYQHALDAFTTAARTILQLAEVLDLDQMQAVCARYETLAPLLEPTAYMRGGRDNLGDQAAFLGALRRFVDEVRKLDKGEADVADEDPALADEQTQRRPDDTVTVSRADLDLVMNRAACIDGWANYADACDRIRAALNNQGE